MGSFYARQYLCEYGRELNGAIIMGTGFQPKALVKVAKTLCRVLATFHGWHYRSSLVASLSFMGYNKGLEGRTTHDWLNRDQAEVDKYLAEERCTFTFTLNAYYSMFSGILRLHDPAFLARMPKRPAAALPLRRCRPGGRTGQGRAPRHPEPEGRRRAEHRKHLLPRCPPRAAGGDQQAGGLRGHRRMAGQTAGKTVKTSKGLLHKTCGNPFIFIPHSVYSAAGSAPRRGSFPDRCGSALRPAESLSPAPSALRSGRYPLPAAPRCPQ